MAISLLASCEEDKLKKDIIDPPVVPIPTAHRIAQVTFDYGPNQTNDYKYTFTYEEDHLVSCLFSERTADGDWYESYKTEISYDGECATEIYYDAGSGNWEMYAKSEYLIQNDLTMEETSFEYDEGLWAEDVKWTYRYDGNVLVAWQSFSDVEGTWKPCKKGEYLYQNGHLTEMKMYTLDALGVWYQSNREAFTYNEDCLQNVVRFDLDLSGNETHEKKVVYLFSDNEVVRSEHLNWSPAANDWIWTMAYSYVYDDEGYLVEKTYSSGTKMTYEYEEGVGNAIHFWAYPEDGVYEIPAFR